MIGANQGGTADQRICPWHTRIGAFLFQKNNKTYFRRNEQ